MDENALRAMMPTSFGKKGPIRAVAKKPTVPPLASESTASNGASTPKATTEIAKSLSYGNGVTGGLPSPSTAHPAHSDDGEFDEDGLTREEREANRQAEMDAKARVKSNKAKSDTDDDDEDEDDDDDDDELGPEPATPDATSTLPMEQSVLLMDHSKAITALSIDASGARIATGSLDTDVKLWDFGGMTQSFRPYKTFEPFESHAVQDAAWSANGEHLLVATGTAQAQVFDRNGSALYTYKKGDMYIRDMRNTAGHVAEITSCFWHPIDKDIFATTSADSSIRLWNVEETEFQKTCIVVKSKERGTRTKVTCGAFSADGKMLAAGCLDGALHIYSTSGSYSRPSASVEGAHVKDAGITSICFTRDGRTLASRGGDGTVKLWDTRSFKKPIAERGNLSNLHNGTNVIFSPDETMLLTGTSAERAGEDEEGRLGEIVKPGRVEVLARSNLQTLKSIEIDGDASSVVKVAWHPRINQIFAATSSGAVHLYYSPTLSSRGALLCVDKKGRVRTRAEDYEDEYGLTGPIITPGAMDPSDRGQGFSQMSKKRKMEKMRQDPVASRMPDRPMEGRGKGGRIGAAAQQHLAQGMYTDLSREEDPREALLKYAEQAEKDPKYTSAWKETQPTPIFQQGNGDEYDDGRGRERQQRGGRPRPN